MAPDVLVVGAGVAGAATALALSEAGTRVLLVEERRPGFGASGRNPGFLWMQSKAVGLPLDFSMTGRRLQETVAGEIGDFGFRACGGLTFFRDPALLPRLEALVVGRRKAGLSFELLDSAALRAAAPALDPDIPGALWCPLDAHQDTRRLVDRLVAAAQRRGAELRCPARVAEILVAGGRAHGVRLEDGSELGAGTVVVAAGVDALRLLEPLGLALPLRPVRYEAAESAPAPFALGPVVCGPGVLEHLGLAGTSERRLPPGRSFTHQAAQYGDGRVQYGCLASEGIDSLEPTPEGQALADAAWARDLPGLGALAVERRWAGVVAQTPDYLPVIDPAPGVDGLALNCALAFGNIVGVLSGRMLAAALSGGTPPFPLEPFAAGRFITPCS